MTPALVAALCLFATERTLAQDQPRASDELDVTMQIIVDPDAKLPDEVIRKIPLPARHSQGSATSGGKPQPSADSVDKGPDLGAEKASERAIEARELGSEMAERAKEKKDEAAEQREEARRAAAEEREREREREPGPPDDPPGRPPNPPGR